MEQAVTRPHFEAEMKAAYAAALAKVRALARQRSEPALWQILDHPTPAGLQALKSRRVYPAKSLWRRKAAATQCSRTHGEFIGRAKVSTIRSHSDFLGFL